MSKYTELEKAIKELKKKGLGSKADGKEWYESASQRSLTFYAFNDCNKGLLTMTTGYNHVQLYFVFNKPMGTRLGEAYYVMEYSKNVPKREGELPSKYKDTPTAVQLPLDTFNPPQFENNKLKVTYTDKKGKLCNVLLGPCNTPEKEQEYKCPVRGPDFVDDEDWKEKVNIWFKTRLDTAINIARIPTEWRGEKITIEQALAPLRDPGYVSPDPRLKRVEVAVTGVQSKTDETAKKTSGETEKHLQDVKTLLQEHDEAMKKVDKAMVPVLGTEEQKIGGKKSRKNRRTKRRKSNRRTKRRKSNRRKKGKKTKKH